MSNPPRMLAVLGLGLAVCAVAAMNLGSAPAANTEATEPTETAQAASGTSSAGLRAFVDPETGALREATAEDLAAAAQQDPAMVGREAIVEVIHHANGMKSAVLDESFMATSVAKVGPDGRLITDCVLSREEYDAFFGTTTTTAGPEVQ